MVQKKDKIIPQHSTDSIQNTLYALAERVGKEVTDDGSFLPVGTDFACPTDFPEIPSWRIQVISLPACDLPDTRQRIIELIGLTGDGYGLSLFVTKGDKAKCVALLKQPSFADRIREAMTHCVQNLGD